MFWAGVGLLRFLQPSGAQRLQHLSDLESAAAAAVWGSEAAQPQLLAVAGTDKVRSKRAIVEAQQQPATLGFQLFARTQTTPGSPDTPRIGANLAGVPRPASSGKLSAHAVPGKPGSATQVLARKLTGAKTIKPLDLATWGEGPQDEAETKGPGPLSSKAGTPHVRLLTREQFQARR